MERENINELYETFGETCIIGIIGERGGGKTNYAVALTLSLSKYFEKPIVSNIKLFGVDYLPFNMNMLETLDDRLENCVLLIDELHMYNDSYDFLSKNSRKMTILATQLRKRNAIFIYTVQYVEMITKRVRSQTDWVIEAINRKKSPIKITNDTEWTSFIKYSTFTNDEIDTPFRVSIFNGKPYWGNYDTNEIVTGK